MEYYVEIDEENKNRLRDFCKCNEKKTNTEIPYIRKYSDRLL
jgi:hypothetical protein